MRWRRGGRARGSRPSNPRLEAGGPRSGGAVKKKASGSWLRATARIVRTAPALRATSPLGEDFEGRSNLLSSDRKAIAAARAARRAMSQPEIMLWSVLKTRPGGFKFRHEHPAGPYRFDFYCDRAKLCVEVDGEAHERGDRPARDQGRDAWAALHGIDTLRVPARDVLRELEAVVTMIVERCRERT